MNFDTMVGGAAAFCTTVSYFPQLKKAWESGHTGDLSLTMLIVLSCGLALWTVYGFMRKDPVIIIANSISVACLMTILALKLRGERTRRAHR